MKKIILIAVTGAVLITCTLISAIATNATAHKEDYYNVYETEAVEKVFLLGERNGRLVVFREGESEPFIETEALVKTLPKADRQRLEQGIEIRGEENLQKAIEDYCS